MDEQKSFARTDEAIAAFRIFVTSVDNSTWQGVAEAGGRQYHFQSELQLLRWLTEEFPALRPEVAWENDKNEEE